MPRILYGLLGLIVLAAAPAHATLRTWPGAAPCDTTLNACLAAAATDDVVQVQSNGPIDENVTFTKALVLEAAPGYRPVLAAGRSIQPVYAPGVGISGSMRIEGFTVLNGFVRVVMTSGNLDVTLRRLDVTATTSPSVFTTIGLYNGGTGQLNYEIFENRARLSSGTSTNGIFVDGAAMAGSIHDNRISADAADADGGIGVRTNTAGSSALIYANQVSGNVSGGVDLTLTVDFSANIVSNAIYCTAPSANTAGIRSISYSGSLAAQVFNNTVAGCRQGLSLNGFNSASLSGRLANNVVANNTINGLVISAPTSTLSNDHNLVFGNGSNTYTPGTGTLTSDPLFVRGASNPRLSQGSPAINAADSAALATLLANLSVPEIDGDGSRRFKGAASLADIGAFEYGDAGVIESATAANGGVIDSALLNGNSGALPQLTQNQNADTYVAMAVDTGFTGLNYASSHFGAIDEIDGSAPTAQSAYDVFVPAVGNGVFKHTSSGANVFGFTTELTDAYVVGQSSRVVLATHLGPTLFDHPFGLAFGFGNWFLVQLDAVVEFPSGVDFAIYAQDPSLNAFVWNAPVAGATMPLDHVLLNGEPCGRVRATNGNSNPHPIGVKYAAQRWTIVNVDGAAMPADAQFNVVVDEAATDFCRYDHIFHDGVEGA